MLALTSKTDCYKAQASSIECIGFTGFNTKTNAIFIIILMVFLPLFNVMFYLSFENAKCLLKLDNIKEQENDAM